MYIFERERKCMGMGSGKEIKEEGKGREGTEEGSGRILEGKERGG